MTAPAMAGNAGLSLSLGGSITSHHRWTVSAFFDLTTPTHTVEDLHWQPAYTLGWVQHRRRTLGNLDHDVLLGAAGVRLVDWWRKAFFSFQFGAAHGRTDALSSGPQFVSSLGWQEPHWQVMVRHISNGKFFHGPNLGETMVLVGIRL